MKKIALIISTLTLALATRAEVFIYNQSYTRTYTGLGGISVTHYSGYVILDNQGHLDQIDLITASKTFYVDTRANPFTINYLRSSPTKELFVIAVPLVDFDQGLCFVKGKTSEVNTGTTLFDIAKSLTFNGSGLSGTDPDAQIVDFKGGMTLNLKATSSANLAGNDINAAIAILVNGLIAKGYHQG